MHNKPIVCAIVVAASVTLAASWSTNATPATSKKTPATDVCFGGPPQVVLGTVGPLGQHGVTGRWRNTLFQVVDGLLLWSANRDLLQIDLTTLVPSARRLKRPMILVAAHGGEALGIEEMNNRTFGGDLFAVDLRTGEERTVLAGGPEQRFFPYQFDGDDLYFIRGPYNVHSNVGDKGATFNRLHHGRGEPEFLGFEPHGTYTSFRVDHGFVYWNREMGKDAFELSRKALAADAPVERLASTTMLHVPFALAHGRVYYLDDGLLSSVPIDGSKPATVISASAGIGATNLLVDHKCLYWTNQKGIVRTRPDGKGTPEIVADADTYRGGAIATDGTFLYWHDPTHNRFLRAGRDSRSLQPRPVVLAKPVDLHEQPPDGVAAGSSVAVGDGWGCARVFGWNQANWQCWGADFVPSDAPHVRAKSVPWLSSAELPVGPDRLCFLNKRSDLCWPWPIFAQQRPSDLPEVQEREGRGSTESRDGQLLVGGTFACTIQYVGSERMLKCSGDNSYGQLAEGEQPEMTEPWYGWHGAMGTWHGCVAARGKEPPYCWGRGDGGQLGFETSETCAVAGRRIPCSKSLHKASISVGGMSRLFAGDMFTCGVSGSPRRLLCWGASHDGWIGGTACPSELRKAWPVHAGFTPAPQATCSRAPVEIPALKGVENDLSVGPRGACGIVDKHIRCVGAIRTPSIEVSQVRVSPGAHASACGIAGTNVLCWGDGYSPAGNPSLAVPVAFATTQPLTAVVDFPPPAGTQWPQDRLIYRGCSDPTVPLPKCPPGTTGKPWSELASEAVELKGKTVSVRDRLLVAPIAWEETKWQTRGNNDAFEYHTRPLVLGEGDVPLRLGGDRPRFACGGDASRLCCKTQAFGQTVVASGVLSGANSYGWVLRSAEICEVPNEGN